MMSEVEDQIENEVETNPINDLVQAAMNQDYTTANEIFNDMMSDKVSDALDQEKIAIANQLYNGGEPEDDDYEVDDVDIDQQDDTDLELDNDEEWEEDEN
jgi:hypothetical protein